MSTSVYPVVGRVKKLLPGFSVRHTEDELSIQWPERSPVDFEFMYVDKEYPDCPDNVMTHMYDNYPLFSWLADKRGNSQPRPDHLQWLAFTERFMDWIGNHPGVTYLDPGQTKAPKDTMREHYFDGYYSPTLYFIDDLLKFNYDTVAYVHDGYDADHNQTYKPHPDLKTWRECFEGFNDRGQSKGYFEFLTEAKAKGWGFIIFAFD